MMTHRRLSELAEKARLAHYGRWTKCSIAGHKTRLLDRFHFGTLNYSRFHLVVTPPHCPPFYATPVGVPGPLISEKFVVPMITIVCRCAVVAAKY
jgi:hypothetical protein